MESNANAGEDAGHDDQKDKHHDRRAPRKRRGQGARRRARDRMRMSDAYFRAATESALNPEDAPREFATAIEAVRDLRRSPHLSDARSLGLVQQEYLQAAWETARRVEDVPIEAAAAAEAVAALRRGSNESAGDASPTPQIVSQGTQTDGPMEEGNNTAVSAAETSSGPYEDVEPAAHDERTYCRV